MLEAMKTKLARYLPAQNGQSLIIVLVLLTFGSLILTSLLPFMSTALKTGRTYDVRDTQIYTADSGIEDGLWRVKYGFMGGDYDPYDFETAWPYNTDNVNRSSANFTIMNVWFPSDVTLDSAGLTSAEAKAMIDSGKLIVAGTSGAVPGNPYSIKIDFTPDVGDNLTVKSLGVWLPQGFEYVADSCSLESGGHTHVYNPDTVTVADAPGGQTIVWSYDEDYPLFTEFPGVDSEALPMTLNFDFMYTPPAAHPDWLPTAIAWITTDMNVGSLGYANDDDVPLSWDVDTSFYKIISQSGSTIVEAYSSKSEMRKMGDAMSGDYVAIGNSLLADDNHDNYRETWHTPSSFDLNAVDNVSIPSDADVAYAYLYWSGWRNDAAKVNITNDDCSSLTNWTRSDDDQSLTRYPTGDVSHSGTWDKTSSMYTYVDETGANDGDTTYLLHGTSEGSALFSFSAFTAPADSVIKDLTVYLVARENSSGTNKMQPALRVGGTDYTTTSTSTEVTSNYTTISYVYTTNPRSTVVWTADDINGIGSNALQAFGVRSADANPQIRLTQVYAVVTYCESRWSVVSGKFQGQGIASTSDARRTLTLTTGLNLSSYTPTTVVVCWDQTESGTLESTDTLYFALSGDGGATWSDDIDAFHDDSPDSPYWYPIPESYLPDFKIRFYFNFNDTAEYVQLDNIKVIYMTPDTSITFKINNQQVYFNGSEPADGTQPLTAGRSYAMFNTMSGVPEGYSYACVRDVSALVKKYPVVAGEEHHTGNTVYTVDNVTADIYKTGITKSNFAFAGWSLIIVYACPETAGRYIYIRDNNFAFHPGIGGDLDFDDDPDYAGGIITNFVVPEPLRDGAGQIIETSPAITLTCFAVEGDNFGTSSIHITGEQSGNSMDLWNVNSPSPDAFNGASYPGTFNDGVDIDTFNVYWDDDILTPNDNKLYVDMYSNGDAWNLVYFIISIRSETVTGGTTHYVIHGG
jgi:hypothetical protein